MGLVQREHLFGLAGGGGAGEDVASEGPAVGFELVAGAEQVGVVRHVEHGHEREAPGVAVGVAVADEDGDAAVDGEGELGVAAGSEHWAGAGVRVEQRQLLGREGEAGIGVEQLVHTPKGECELRNGLSTLQARHG